MTSSTIPVRAILVGQEIRLRQFHNIHALSRAPFTIEVEGGGIGVLFRFGVVVMFEVSPMAEAAFLDMLQPFIRAPYDEPQAESLAIHILEGIEERVDAEGLFLPDRDLSRLQLVAEALAKSELLDNYEQRIAGTFDRMEPLAEQIQLSGRLPKQARDLLGHIGEILEIQHRMVGRAQVGEKPDILWERPELERLWQRLENEYEISERQLALERKLDLISSTAGTLLELLQNRRSLRVEWYIVILIVIEIMLTLYELFFRHAQ